MVDFLLLYPSVAFLLLIVIGCIVRWWRVPGDRKRTEYVMVGLIFISLTAGVAQGIANWMTHLRPMKYDLYIYQIDSIFGQPSFVLGRIVRLHLWMTAVLQVAYGILPTMASAVIAAYVYARKEQLREIVTAFGVNLLAAPIFYLLFPVCGPLFAFPHFPDAPGLVAAHLVPISAAPNGVPSVHTSTAILILWAAWRWRPGRVMAGAYLILILLATLASGEHYFFDLIAAIPYSAAVIYVSRRLSSAAMYSAKFQVETRTVPDKEWGRAG